MRYYADVILPLALDKPFTYAVEEQDYQILKPGFRVAVSFGKSKIYTGVVIKLHQVQPQTYTAKYIEMVLEETASITDKQLTLWKWLSEYYQCKIGEIMRAAFPTTFLLESETIVIKKEIDDVQVTDLSDHEYLVYEALETKALSVNEIIEILGKKSVLGLIQQMFSKGLIDIHQKLEEKYKPKKIRHVRVSEAYIEENSLESIFTSLKNAPKQKQLLLGIFDKNPNGDQWKKVSDLIQQTNSNSSVLRSMISKGIIVEEFFREDRLVWLVGVL